MDTTLFDSLTKALGSHDEKVRHHSAGLAEARKQSGLANLDLANEMLRLYAEGTPFPGHDDESAYPVLDAYEAAIECGIAKAHLHYGRYKLDASGGKEEYRHDDIAEAMKEWEKGAEKGDSDCMLELARVPDCMFPTKADAADHRWKWLGRAIRAGNEEAAAEVADWVPRSA